MNDTMSPTSSTCCCKKTKGLNGALVNVVESPLWLQNPCSMMLLVIFYAVSYYFTLLLLSYFFLAVVIVIIITLSLVPSLRNLLSCCVLFFLVDVANFIAVA